MKSVVVQIHSGIAVVLSDDGRIVKVRNQKYVIGQVIEMKATTKRKIHFPSAVAAAAVAIFMCSIIGVSAYAYYTPYSYVSLDVNPSIEYSLNRFNRVLKVTGVNDEGKEIVQELNLDNLSNKTIDEAIKLTVKQIGEDGYFSGEEEGGVVISTSAKDLKKAESLAGDLEQTAKDAAEGKNIEVVSISVGLERVQAAHNLGVTPGKLNLVEKLRDSSQTPDDVNIDEWLSKPVKEIMKEIKSNHNQARALNQEKGSSQNGDSVSNVDTSKAEDSSQSEDKSESKAEKAENKLEEKQKKTTNTSNVQESQNTSEVETNQAKQKGNSTKQDNHD